MWSASTSLAQPSVIYHHLWGEPVLVEILVKSTGKAETPQKFAIIQLFTQRGYKAMYLTVRLNIDSSFGSNSFYDFSNRSPEFL